MLRDRRHQHPILEEVTAGVHRLLRLLWALPLAALLVTVAVPAGAQAVGYSAQEIELVKLLNDYREGLGLNRLMVSDLASDAARKHSSDMAKYTFFGHRTQASDFFPAGCDGGRRLILCGYPSYLGWGENIAAGYSQARSLLEGWKASSAHDAIMTSPRFNVVGIGMVYSQASPWGYYWTADFGTAVDATAHWLDGSPTTTTTTTTAPSTVSTTTTTTTVAPPDTGTTTSVPGQPPGSSTTTVTSEPSAPTTTTTVTTPPVGVVEFADVPPGHRFHEAIVSLAAAGAVNGFDDGLFHPDEWATRGQLAKIIVLALDAHTEEVDNAAVPTFADVPYEGDAYPFDFVEEAAALGIVWGFDDGTFRPTANVTRLQLALMLVRAGEDRLATPPAGRSCPFTDVPAYGQTAVATAYYNGLLAGKTATTFDPYSTATRGHVAQMVYKLRQALGL